MEITEKRVIPIKLASEEVRQAIEEFVRRKRKGFVFPKKYDVLFYPTTMAPGSQLIQVDQWPDVHINIEIVEPRIGRPKGSKTRAPVISGPGFQPPTEYESIPAQE